MGKWATVQGMKMKPYCCIGCGSTPMEDEETQSEAIFLEGVDVNWGDSVYLCKTCARIIGELRGMLDPDEAKRLRDDEASTRKELEETLKDVDRLTTRLEQITAGSRALKEQKAENKKKEGVKNAKRTPVRS